MYVSSRPPTENESKEKQKSRQCHPLTANSGSRDYGIQALLKMPDNIPAPLIQVINDTIS
ncbi:hypothetical protein [Escherichia coli]|uniref:hypothetical protein n=1 Tax=Escherichia coli TaxID=562 RepID=UPI00223705AE|nr:hypothetical protein [Escherichia coli]MCW7358826.1 hypothetical protein [Escherichia coli]